MDRKTQKSEKSNHPSENSAQRAGKTRRKSENVFGIVRMAMGGAFSVGLFIYGLLHVLTIFADVTDFV